MFLISFFLFFLFFFFFFSDISYLTSNPARTWLGLRSWRNGWISGVLLLVLGVGYTCDFSDWSPLSNNKPIIRTHDAAISHLIPSFCIVDGTYGYMMGGLSLLTRVSYTNLVSERASSWDVSRVLMLSLLRMLPATVYLYSPHLLEACLAGE